MKIKPAKVVKRVVNMAIIPVNMVITAVNLVIQFAPLGLYYAKAVVRLPGRIFTTVKDIRRVGLYEFVDRKDRRFNILLGDSQATEAIENPNAHAARQMVLQELRQAVAVDTRCPDFALPEAIYLWNHPVKGFKSIKRLRDATSSERKEYLDSPLRRSISEYIDYAAAR